MLIFCSRNSYYYCNIKCCCA